MTFFLNVMNYNSFGDNMGKKFRSRRKKLNLKHLLIFIILVLFVFIISFNFLYNKLTKKISEVDITNILLGNPNINFKDIFKENSIDFIVSYTLGIKLDNNKTLKKENKENIIIESPNNDVVENPIIYIYNTHQTEEYKKINENSYNITPTVMHASLVFQSKLKELGINSIVEKNSIKEILDINSWSYRNSYKASKMLAENTLSDNPTIKYVIDIHRDSIPEKSSYTNIDGKNYARMMIVLGTGHDGYNNNLEMANRINNYLKEFDESITRGIDIKKNSGIYNQDLSPTALLIEIGGEYNDISSVSNSLEVLANAYKKVIDEDNEKKEI